MVLFPSGEVYKEIEPGENRELYYIQNQEQSTLILLSLLLCGLHWEEDLGFEALVGSIELVGFTGHTYTQSTFFSCKVASKINVVKKCSRNWR